jgi:transcription antitermination factor NusG
MRNNHRTTNTRNTTKVTKMSELKDAENNTITKGDIVQIYDGNKQGYVYKVADLDLTTGEVWLTQAGRLIPQKVHHSQLIVM